MCCFQFTEIDAILVSNHTTMLALPYLTEKTGFKGEVYATEPTITFGRYAFMLVFIIAFVWALWLLVHFTQRCM